MVAGCSTSFVVECRAVDLQAGHGARQWGHYQAGFMKVKQPGPACPEHNELASLGSSLR
jgi:hypothetical protein